MANKPTIGGFILNDVIKQLAGFLSALLLFLGTLNIQFEWFTKESIDAFVLVVSAGLLFGTSMFTIYKNHYGFTQKAKQQKEELKKNELL